MKRIDNILANSGICTRSEAHKIIMSGRVSVNGKVVRASYDVKVGDEITINFGAKPLSVRVLEVKETAFKDDAKNMYEAI